MGNGSWRQEKTLLVTKHFAGERKLPSWGMACSSPCWISGLGRTKGAPSSCPSHNIPLGSTLLFAHRQMHWFMSPGDAICEICRLPPLELWLLLNFRLCPCFDTPLSPLPAPRSGRQPPTEHSTAQGHDLLQGTGQPRREGRQMFVRKGNSERPTSPWGEVEVMSKALCPES